MSLTKKHQAEIQAYVDELRGHVALLDWWIKVEKEFADDDEAASIRCIYGTRHAFLSIGVSFDDHPLLQQRQVIVHELLHCHLNRIKLPVANISTNLGDVVFDTLRGMMTDEIEFATDAIADALAPKCPMPPWDS